MPDGGDSGSVTPVRLASPWNVVKVWPPEACVTSLSIAMAVPLRAPVSMNVFLKVAMVLSPAVRESNITLLTRVVVPCPIMGLVA